MGCRGDTNPCEMYAAGTPIENASGENPHCVYNQRSTARRLVSLSKVYAQWESMDLDFHKELNYTGWLSRLV